MTSPLDANFSSAGSLHLGQDRLEPLPTDEHLERAGYLYTIENAKFADKTKSLVVDAYKKGNETWAINDPRGLKKSSSQTNCMWVEVSRNGWPYVFVVAKKDIEPNAELLIEYVRHVFVVSMVTPHIQIIVFSGPSAGQGILDGKGHLGQSASGVWASSSEGWGRISSL